MKSPLSMANHMPAGCRCWMLRGDEHPYREICEQFEPNPFAALAGHELCYDCEHPEACHGPSLV